MTRPGGFATIETRPTKPAVFHREPTKPLRPLWSVADLLRGDYKQSDYGKVILPFSVLRRIDWMLALTKAAMLAEHDARLSFGIHADPFLLRKSGQSSDMD